MYHEQPIHPVTRENLRAVRPVGKCWRMEARDRFGRNPALIGYVSAEPTERRLGQFTRHYATLIYAMPREIETSVVEL